MKTTSFAFLAVLLAAASTAPAAEPTTAPTSQPAVTAAVLDYEASCPGNRDMGMQMAEVLTARLSVEDSFQLVERSTLGKILDEQKLKLVGLVDQEQAAKVGKLLGAKLLITGKAFQMDQKLMIVTKVVGVETGLIKGTIRTVEMNKPLSDTIMAVSEDVAALIKKEAAGLLPKGSELDDQLGQIMKALGDRPRPTVAVIIPEHHIEHAVPRRIVDPAVETEIKKTLGDCKFKLVDLGRNDLADWAKDMLKGGDKPWPAALQDADLIVVGEGFSEFAVRTGDLVTCTARAEINVIDRRTGKIILAGRHTTRAVDLAESTAGKTALQMAGRQLGIEVCRKLVDYKKPEIPTTKPAEK
jgi:TolB-like protein